MTGQPDDTPSWDEHADGLRGEQQALAMLRGLLSVDETDVEAAIGELHEVIQHAADTGDYGPLEAYQAGLARLVIQFGQEVHGHYLDAVLERMQRDLAAHIAEYEPEAEQ